MKSYKGFNQDMTCRGKQYEEGKTYTETEVDCCHKGMHACEYPLDCFKHYAPATSVYHEVEQDGELSRDSDDSKVASSVLKVGARLDIPGLVHAAIEYTKSRCTTEHTDPKMSTAGDSGAATSRGKSASGKNGLSVARGNGCMVKGGLGAILVIAEEERDSYDIAEWKAVVVDGEKIKPDTWYNLENGELFEHEEGKTCD